MGKKDKINDRLRRIANVLLLNASFTDNLGLLNGKMGVALFIYMYGRHTGNPIYDDFAGELLDEIFEDISYNSPIDFATGLTGIGWGIEYLVKEGFIEANTDEVLVDIDRAIFQKSLNIEMLLNSEDDFFGNGLYYISRLWNHNIDDDRLPILIKKNYIIFLVDECERFLLQQSYIEKGIKQLSLKKLGSLLWFLYSTHELGIFPSKTGKLLKHLSKYIQSYVDEADSIAEIQLIANITHKISELSKDEEISWAYKCIEDNIDPNWDIHTDKELINDLSELYFSDIIYRTTNETSIDYRTLCHKALDVLDSIDIADYIKTTPYNNDSFSSLARLGIFLLRCTTFFPPIQNEPKQTDHSTNVFLVVYNYSGARTYVDELTSYLSTTKNINVYRVFLIQNNIIEFHTRTKDNITDIVLPQKITKEYDKTYYKRAAQLLYSHFFFLKNVIFHVNAPEHYYLAEEVKILFQCKVIFTFHFLEGFLSYIDKKDMYGEKQDIIGNVLPGKMLELADKVICVTEFAKRVVTGYYNIAPNKAKVIYNGRQMPDIDATITRTDLRLKYGFNSDDVIVLFAGALKEGKGLDSLIMAFMLLKDNYKNLKLVIVGTGEHEKFLRQSQGCPGRICFTGRLNFEVLSEFYRLSDIGVVPSQYEQGGYVTIEMMQHGLPVIVNNVPGLNEIVVHGKTGLVCDIIIDDNEHIIKADEKDLANHIKRYVDEPLIALRFAKNAKKEVDRMFSKDKMAKNALAQYKCAQQSKRAAAEKPLIE